jgi:hypothetical protein
MATLRAQGAGLCAERVCVMRTRVITPEMDLHLSHDPTGLIVLGLSHAKCNVTEASRRARAMQGRNSGRTAAANRRNQGVRSPLRW